MSVFRNLQRRKDYSGHKWTTRDGDVIPVEEMTPSHLNNVIRFMERNADRIAERADRIYIAGMEPGDDPFMDGWWPQGEMAQLAVEGWWTADRYDFPPQMKMYAVLVAERDRRNAQRRKFPDGGRS